MSDLTEVAKQSDIKRNAYQQLLWESENGSEWRSSSAKQELQRYYFKRPNESFFDKLILRWLGQLPDKFVLEMNKVKTRRSVSTLAAWLLTFWLTGLTALMFHTLGEVSNLSAFILMLTPLAFIPNPINWVLLAVLIWTCWRFRKEVGSFFRSLLVWSRAVVTDEKSESTEMETGIKIMTFVSGAENWSNLQKIKSVLLSTLAIPGLVALLLPIAFLPAMVGYNIFVLVYYLGQYNKYKDAIQATVETTRTVSLYKTILPIQIGFSMLLWMINTPQLNQLLAKLTQLLNG